MKASVLAAVAALAILLPTSAHASRHHQTSGQPVQQFCDTRYCGLSATEPEGRRKAAHRRSIGRGHVERQARRKAHSREAVAESRTVSHPEGCPRRAFCGCGVSLRAFGRSIRPLWLAAEWLRRFPRAVAAAGMVAARQHHVFYIERMLSPTVALAYDPNSGGHMTRIHPRSLRGYVVVNPHAGLAAAPEKAKPIIMASVDPTDMPRFLPKALDQAGDANKLIGKVTLASRFNDQHVACRPGHLIAGRFEVAHPTLPCGTKLRVTNLGNGRSVEAYVADVGPCTTARCRRTRPDIARRRGLDLDHETDRALRAHGMAKVRYSVLE